MRQQLFCCLKNTVPTEPNRLTLVRAVKRDPGAALQAAQKNGIAFECVEKTDCPHCKAVVPLAHAQPLSSVLCPSCGGKMLVPGRVGGFFLYARIGEGAMGSIYRATDESLKREVAVKVVRGCHVADPKSCERLRREACAAGKLNHPRVAQVYALNFSNGHPYLVMELVDGQDFAQKQQREGRIDERVVLRMALDVADGLSAIDREGLVHGDIKPGNIVLDRDGNAKLVDFGLSGMTRHDGSGIFVGTPEYIAPELLRGEADTHRSDIYSFGATLYHLLSGRPPLDGETSSDVLKARLLRQPVPLIAHTRYVSLPTRKLIMKMIEGDPAKRPANSDVIAADIREALAQLESTGPAPSIAARLARRFVGWLRLPLRPLFAASKPRRYSTMTVILGLIAGIELLVAVKQHSFSLTWAWLRREVAGFSPAFSSDGHDRQTQAQPDAAPVREEAGHADLTTMPLYQPHRAFELAVPESEVLFTAEANPVWQSINLGVSTQRGSTLKMDGALIVQGAGKDMWKGYDRCRFVWTKAARDYALSAQVMAIADNGAFDITGLLVKGPDPALGPGLLFGFLGSGELFLQIREPGNRAAVVKRSERPYKLPRHLRFIRRGRVFEAYCSADGRAWTFFSACELELPPDNTIGFAVSAQDPDALATAKFASVRLLTPGLPLAARTNALPAVLRTPVRAAPKK
jgi:tRNA A-37 threonylcarbamoyl transferase component Bud32